MHDGDEAGEGAAGVLVAAGDEPASRVEHGDLPPAMAAPLLRVVETRPLQVLDLVGIPMPGTGGSTYGPALVAA